MTFVTTKIVKDIYVNNVLKCTHYTLVLASSRKSYKIQTSNIPTLFTYNDKWCIKKHVSKVDAFTYSKGENWIRFIIYIAVYLKEYFPLFFVCLFLLEYQHIK